MPKPAGPGVKVQPIAQSVRQSVAVAKTLPSIERVCERRQNSSAGPMHEASIAVPPPCPVAAYSMRAWVVPGGSEKGTVIAPSVDETVDENSGIAPRTFRRA